jgi:hypothetical protein
MFRDFLNEVMEKVGSSDSIKRTDLVVGLNSLLRVLKETTENNSKSLQDALKKSDSKNVVKMLQKNGLVVTTNEEVAELLKVDYEVITQLITEAIELVESFMPEITIQDTVTIRQNAILDLLGHADSLTNYYSELLMLIVYSMNDEVSIIYRKKTDDLNSGVKKYNIMMGIYRKGLSKVVKDIRELSDTRITENVGNLKEVASAKDIAFALPVNGFNGNPIQAIGKWWVDFQLYRADKLEDSKYLVEYKLMQLREKKERGDVTTETDKAIQFYEKKVQKLDKKIYSLRKV